MSADHGGSGSDSAEAILRVAAMSVKSFSGERPWEEVVPEVFKALGEAAGVSRVYLFENVTLEDGRLAMDKRFEWVAPGVSPTIDAPVNRQFPYDGGYERYVEILSADGVISGPASTFPPGELADLEDEGVLSTAFVPVFVGDGWWGYLGFDDCVTARQWPPVAIASLRTVAGIIGSAILTNRLEGEAKQATAWLETHIANLPAVTYIEFTDEDHQLGYNEAYVSPQIFDMFGYTQEAWLRTADDPEWLGSAYIHPDDREEAVRLATVTARTGEPYLAEYRMRHFLTGEYIWVRDEAHLVEGDGDVRPYWHGVIVDITERKKMEEQIEFLAYHDSLTGLANRKLLQEMLEPALARARRSDMAVALLFMDLDNFKQVNDTLGHDVGDLLLKQVTARLLEATRETDLVARQGGDEFLVMIPDIDLSTDVRGGEENTFEVAEMMARRVHEAMRAPFSVGDTDVTTSMSIGISVFPYDASDVRNLLKNSDAAMYQSKRAGSGGSAIYARTSGDPLVQASLTNRLRQAVKDTPWMLHYQPMVELETGMMVAVEALLRWRKPMGDLVPPNEFIPLAEEMGLLEVIGDWVLQELCDQVVAWRDRGLELQVSFNLSPRQLWQSNLAEKFSARFGEASIDPGRVIIEVSESTAMADPSRTQRILRALHDKGFRLAIDDFGTGYTPPARLQNLRADILKIDQPLVRDLPDDAEVAGFVKGVIHFASELGIAPLAEGIETEEQFRFLVDQGCKLGQGYLFSRPISGDDLHVLWVDTGGRLSDA